MPTLRIMGGNVFYLIPTHELHAAGTYVGRHVGRYCFVVPFWDDHFDPIDRAPLGRITQGIIPNAFDENLFPNI